jgi:hypothetical protein
MSRLLAPVLFLSLVGLAACQGGGGDDDRETCLRLVDHLVDLQLGEAATADGAHAAEIEKHRVILHHAIEERVVAECLKRPRAHTDCALRAASPADLQECD